LTLLVGRQKQHPACKKTEWWGAGVVICLELGADLYIAQLMPLPLTVSCFSKIQIGFTFLVPAHQGSPGKRAVKWVCVCVCVCVKLTKSDSLHTACHHLTHFLFLFNQPIFSCSSQPRGNHCYSHYQWKTSTRYLKGRLENPHSRSHQPL